jgi:hypothetical protein
MMPFDPVRARVAGDIGRPGDGGWGGDMRRIDPSRPLGSFKKGGKVKKTGKYKLHKGERVLTKKQAKSKGDTHAFIAGRKA